MLVGEREETFADRIVVIIVTARSTQFSKVYDIVEEKCVFFVCVRERERGERQRSVGLLCLVTIAYGISYVAVVSEQTLQMNS